MTFQIKWSVDDIEWELAQLTRRAVRPGSVHDAFFRTRVHVLWGPIQVMYRGVALFPPASVNGLYPRLARSSDPIRRIPIRSVPIMYSGVEADGLAGVILSMTEIAFKFAWYIDRFERGPDGTKTVIEILDHDFRIFLSKADGAVTVTTDLFARPKLIVPESEFILGVRNFVTDFQHQVEQRAPTMLEWKSFDVVARYLDIDPPWSIGGI